jgi:4-diphosphocytidyl-2-C-methyl-D-erythritol kinase
MGGMPTVVRSHAKINLGLYLGAARADGFHSLVTVYQTLEMFDLVTVTARRTPGLASALRVTSNDERVPLDSRNTAWKMVALALDALGVTAAVAIHIEKRLPVQGGMGAGSANAVAALVGLEAELGIDPRDDAQWLAARLTIAAQVGSDVPLFLIGGTVLGLDRGQEVSALPDLDPAWCLMALPEVGVSTPQAFRDWDELCVTDGLTPEASHAKLSELSRAYVSAFARLNPDSGRISRGEQGAGSSGVLPMGENLAGTQEAALVRTGISSWIQNDFERVVFSQHPSLAQFKRLLASPGTPEAAGASSSLVSMLSGSGSALFGLYQARGEAEAAQRRLTDARVRSSLTRTLPRARYWSDMILQQES